MITAELKVYEVSQAWTDAARLLGRVVRKGATIGNRERASLRAAIAACDGALECLTGPSDDLAMVQVAAALLEVVQPIYSRPLLVEHLVRAQAYLALLVASEPGLETVALNAAQLAWLEEFLSECCLMLLRDLATRQLSRHAIAVGS